MQVGNSSRIINNPSAAEQIIKQSTARNNVNFTSASSLDKQIFQEIAPKGKYKLLELFYKAGKKNSEIVNIIVNNIGTALVAPVFIAFNPLAKQDQDTKTYSAMRQPISAVLALASQFGINYTFNQFVDKKVSEGKFLSVDLSTKPQESYLQKQVKTEFKEGKNNGTEKEEKLSKDELDKRVQSKIDEANTTANKNQQKAFNEMNAEDLLKQLEIDSSELSKIDTKSEVFAKNLVKQFIDIPDNITGTNRLKEQDKQTKEFLKGFKKDGENYLAERLKEKGKTLEGFKAELATEQLVKKLGFEKGDAKLINGGADEFIKKLGLNLTEKLKGEKAEHVLENIAKELGKAPSELMEKAAKAIVNNKNGAMENRFKVVKVFVGIGLSLATLPPTCSLLNWLYPRFMEKVFPNLANAKTGKEGK